MHLLKKKKTKNKACKEALNWKYYQRSVVPFSQKTPNTVMFVYDTGDVFMYFYIDIVPFPSVRCRQVIRIEPRIAE